MEFVPKIMETKRSPNAKPPCGGVYMGINEKAKFFLISSSERPRSENIMLHFGVMNNTSTTHFFTIDYIISARINLKSHLEKDLLKRVAVV